MYFIYQPSTRRSRPGPTGGFGCGGGNRFGGRIAESQQNLFGFLRVVLAQFGQGLVEGFEAEVPFAFGALNPVKEGRQINQLAAGVHEVEIENLLACHNVRSTQYSVRPKSSKLQTPSAKETPSP